MANLCPRLSFFSLTLVFSVAAKAPTLLWQTRVGCEYWSIEECPIPFFTGTDSSPIVAPDGQVIVGSYNSVMYSINPKTGNITHQWPDSSSGESAPYVTSKNVIISPAGTIPGRLQFINGTDGAVLGFWSYCPPSQSAWTYSCAIANAGAIDEERGLVFAGGLDETFYAVDINTRTTVWQYPVHGQVWSTLGALSLGDKVCFGVGGSGSADKNCTAELYCLFKSNGNLAWKQRTGIQIQARPAFGKVTNSVYIGDYDGCLYAFDADSGSQRWPKLCTAGRLESSPTVWVSGEKETVLVGSGDGGLWAFDGRTGRNLWSTFLTNAVVTKFGMDIVNGGIGSTPSLLERSDGGAVAYVGAQGKGGLFAVDVVTGKVLWSWRSQDRPDELYGASVFVSADKGVIYEGTENGYLYALRIFDDSEVIPSQEGVSSASASIIV